MLSALLAMTLSLAGSQDTGVLRVRVVLQDASGFPVPVARLVVLVSDDPPAAEPRRLRTGADGAVEVKLAAGRYVVELDEPVSFRGRAHTWTQIVEVSAGQSTVLDFTTENAEDAASARISADSSALLSIWRDTVVEIWTPTTHASGAIIDAKGVIATTDRALGDHTAVEVEITSGTQRFKVAGRVLLTSKQTGAAFIWINPAAIATVRPIDPKCSRSEWPAVNYGDVVTSIGWSVLAPKEATDGRVKRVTEQAIFSEMRIGDDTAGGPVFSEAGEFLGVTSIDDDAELRRWEDAWVVPVEQICSTMPAAIANMTGAPPPDTRLPIDPPYAKVPASKTAKAPPPIKADDFDITLFTPQIARNVQSTTNQLRSDFGTWSQYVRDAPPVLLVRVSPQFEEALWKTLARGYAFLQGIQLPAFKGFTANFVRMRAYCGSAEVMPIHPFIIEHKIPNRSPIREGLYAFPIDAFGAHCPTVRVAMYSEKSGDRAGSKEIDPKLFAELTKSP